MGGGKSLIVWGLRIAFDAIFLFAIFLCGYTFLRGGRGLAEDADLCEEKEK